MKKRVAVLFGGRSPEHDVSIVTGLQVLQALDAQKFDAFPVYVTTDGMWYVGEALRDRSFYIPSAENLKDCTKVTLDLSPDVLGRGRLLPSAEKSFWGRKQSIEFDVAIPAFHGYFGEDGRVQSLFELANVPYAGMRPLASNIFMDKAATKHFLHSAGIPLLPFFVIDRPQNGLIIEDADITAATSKIPYPAIIKPVRLGSSIGVAKVTNDDELREAAREIFKMDTQAIVEPFVQNLLEYNVSVSRVDQSIRTSAIERPKTSQELLDFKEKYLSNSTGGSKSKIPGTVSEGMLSLTRDINPEIPAETESNIRHWASECYALALGTGAPRIDFIANAKTGEVWLNEVNPIPGSFGYFLWEAAEKPVLFAELLASLIDEAMQIHNASQMPADPTYPGARIFRRM